MKNAVENTIFQIILDRSDSRCYSKRTSQLRQIKRLYMEYETGKEIDRLTNRHIGKLLDELDQINISEIAKGAIKREFWWLNEDIKQVMAGSPHGRRS